VPNLSPFVFVSPRSTFEKCATLLCMVLDAPLLRKANQHDESTNTIYSSDAYDTSVASAYRAGPKGASRPM
jgi:hypothetical protein